MYTDSSLIFLRNLLKRIKTIFKKKIAFNSTKNFCIKRNLRHKWHVLLECSTVSGLVLLLIVFHELLL